ncbi:MULTISPECIES: cupredoxin domain-containing protein [unclassified Meiothermus]|uniref:cupredoxin domain-containing protein n=1 Tax=unclassified Meiothermus TaxID=370471 RepID=UPI000D7C6B8E|nr:MULTISPECIES: cupredoxin domain-containing protein [unclassified Meiothermus]PZA06954.1 cytochrome C oxidase subunit II [Meiothermus sp. Pnk-1]RYM38342.1 cytochrome C oxidase subunit II [Meiothermus sp. PNK-Is4]
MQDNHKVIEAYERGWLIFGLAMILVFIGVIAYTVLNRGETISRGAGQIDVATVRTTSPFANPRVEQVGGEYVAYVQAFAFGYLPAEIKVKKGVKVTFYITSPDVQHGFYVEGTNINPQIIPGEVTKLEYVFKKAGTYRIVCNEYCGIGHAQMFGKIVVEE